MKKSNKAADRAAENRRKRELRAYRKAMGRPIDPETPVTSWEAFNLYQKEVMAGLPLRHTQMSRDGTLRSIRSSRTLSNRNRKVIITIEMSVKPAAQEVAKQSN